MQFAKNHHLSAEKGGTLVVALSIEVSEWVDAKYLRLVRIVETQWRLSL